MSYPEGPAQTPQSFDNSRISPPIRSSLRDLDPELARGVRKVADAPMTPSSGLVR
jgi:hypothetical protein